MDVMVGIVVVVDVALGIVVESPMVLDSSSASPHEALSAASATTKKTGIRMTARRLTHSQRTGNVCRPRRNLARNR
jgi:hypothetical protein